MRTPYINDGAFYCEFCAPEEATEVYSWEEMGTDTPDHCAGCHALLRVQLTSAGIDYVIEKIEEECRKGFSHYSRIYPQCAGTYYEGSPHYQIMEDWANLLPWRTAQPVRSIRAQRIVDYMRKKVLRTLRVQRLESIR